MLTPLIQKVKKSPDIRTLVSIFFLFLLKDILHLTKILFHIRIGTPRAGNMTLRTERRFFETPPYSTTRR